MVQPYHRCLFSQALVIHMYSTSAQSSTSCHGTSGGFGIAGHPANDLWPKLHSSLVYFSPTTSNIEVTNLPLIPFIYLFNQVYNSSNLNIGTAPWSGGVPKSPVCCWQPQKWGSQAFQFKGLKRINRPSRPKQSSNPMCLSVNVASFAGYFDTS